MTFTSLKNSLHDGMVKLVQLMTDTRNIKTFKDLREWASTVKRDEFGYHFLEDQEESERKVALHIYNGVTQINACSKQGDVYNPCASIIFTENGTTVTPVVDGVTIYDEAETFDINDELSPFVAFLVAVFIQASEDTPKED